MAYDAGMVALCVKEVNELSAGAKVEKVLQPSKDEIILVIRSREGAKTLLLSAVSGSPRLSFTEKERENPLTPPMLCMLLRKHLVGARLAEVRQEGFERIVTLVFDARDEMGFGTRRYLILELMGKYANLFFTDADKKILYVHRPADLGAARPLLPGMTYTLPPERDKLNPLTADKETLEKLLSENAGNTFASFVMSAFAGYGKSVAREMAYRTTGDPDALVKKNPDALARVFSEVAEQVRKGDFCPTAVKNGGKIVEYAFLPLTHYHGCETASYDRVGKLLDDYFAERENANTLKAVGDDVSALLSQNRARLERKLAAQREELTESEKATVFKTYGDLITANLYRLKGGEASAALTDYAEQNADGSFAEKTVPLNPRLTPNQNAQSYYKKYAKAKTAKAHLTEQIALGEQSLWYLSTVADALARAGTSREIEDIREELRATGYLKAPKTKRGADKRKPSTPMTFTSPSGYTVLCGRNNLQNEQLSHKTAGKNDYWFHVKNAPGSHVILVTNGEEPDAKDFTFAAKIAAENSSLAQNDLVEVDYTLVKNLKKPPASPLGFVIYHQNWSCTVRKKEEA